eukprot:1596406-Prymnesium_polylepis.1
MPPRSVALAARVPRGGWNRCAAPPRGAAARRATLRAAAVATRAHHGSNRTTVRPPAVRGGREGRGGGGVARPRAQSPWFAVPLLTLCCAPPHAVLCPSSRCAVPLSDGRRSSSSTWCASARMTPPCPSRSRAASTRCKRCTPPAARAVRRATRPRPRCAWWRTIRRWACAACRAASSARSPACC